MHVFQLGNAPSLQCGNHLVLYFERELCASITKPISDGIHPHTVRSASALIMAALVWTQPVRAEQSWHLMLLCWQGPGHRTNQATVFSEEENRFQVNGCYSLIR